MNNISTKKQHIVAKTYLRYFSPNEDGKKISVIHVNEQYKKGIKQYNSGDKVFWEKNFYDTNVTEDKKAIEKFFGKTIENDYNDLIDQIKKEESLTNTQIKASIFRWIFYSKLRSPIWRDHLRDRFNSSSESREIDSSDLRETHMSFFTNPNLYDYFIKEYSQELVIKKWKILITSTNWITTDSPGIMVNTKEFAKDPENYYPNALWNNIKFDSAFYFPLTSKYCLEIFPYTEMDDIKRNLDTDLITFEKANDYMVNLINFWTMHSASKILISKEDIALNYFKTILQH